VELRSIAILTSSALPELSPDCVIGAQALRKQGAKVTPVIWDETSPEALLRYDRVIVRSIWDYQNKLPRFQTWLDELIRHGVRVLNPASLMKWNLSKRYMAELERDQGVSIVPTAWIPRDASDSLAHLKKFLGETSSQKLVVKPEISAGGHNTFVFERNQEGEILSAIGEIQKLRGDVMLQPFCESVLTLGETSMVYFSDGRSHELSHVVVKKPKSGDFRVQFERGGNYERIVPPRGLLAFGERVVESLEPGWLFARVDVMSYEGSLRLGELEVMEPQLYFRWAPEAAETFARCVLEHE
jgi:glutathione synthase/RimK-type ligase-like ATP-grasp enzyme